MKKNNKGKLTVEEIKKFKTLLLAKRREILGDVSFMENETLRKSRSELSNMPFHMADVGTDNYEQDFMLGLMDGERKVLMEIEDALRRIEEGTYGICEGTSKPIEKGRLEAIPWARYSVAYAGQMEKGLVKRKDSSVESYNDENEERQD